MLGDVTVYCFLGNYYPLYHLLSCTMLKRGTWLFLVSESLWLMPGHLFILDELESPRQALKGDQKLRVLIARGKSVKRGRALETQLLRRRKIGDFKGCS